VAFKHQKIFLRLKQMCRQLETAVQIVAGRFVLAGHQQLAIAQFQLRLLTPFPVQGEQIPVSRIDIVTTPVAHHKLCQTRREITTPAGNGSLQLMLNPGQTGFRSLL